MGLSTAFRRGVDLIFSTLLVCVSLAIAASVAFAPPSE